MFSRILKELKEHAPFTAFGALGGILFMIFFRDIPQEISHKLFYIFHPAHVLISALATAAMYQRHQCPANSKKKCNIGILIAIGYVGSIGIATLSDSVVPYIGESLLNLPNRHHHIGFLEDWWLISILALVGIVIAYINPTTKFPHLFHVLISTWASLFHMLMAMGQGAGILTYLAIFAFLFISVWAPCCISDIAFPLLFVRNKEKSGGK